MKTWNDVAVLACLAALLGTGPVDAVAAGQACQADTKPGHTAHTHARGDPQVPSVRIPRKRCAPLPVPADKGCATGRQARRTNPPPPAGTEASFGDVPVAALVPPSAPYSGEVPPGPAPAPQKRKRGCPAQPAS